MPSPLDLYREDKDKQENGSPCYIGDMTFYLRRHGTPDSKRQMMEVKERLYGLSPSPKEMDEWEIWAHWLAEYGVVDWELLEEDKKGNEKPLEFSRGAARDIFLNREYRYSLVPVLANFCMNYENFLFDQAQEDAEAVKKPSTSTTTSPPKSKRGKNSSTSTKKKASKKSKQ